MNVRSHFDYPVVMSTKHAIGIVYTMFMFAEAIQLTATSNISTYALGKIRPIIAEIVRVSSHDWAAFFASLVHRTLQRSNRDLLLSSGRTCPVPVLSRRIRNRTSASTRANLNGAYCVHEFIRTCKTVYMYDCVVIDE